MTHVRLARPDDADAVARLMLSFRDHLGLSGPTDDEMRAGVERLLGDADTEFLLAAPAGNEPPAGVAQLRFRYGVWRAGGDCLLEDLFVEPAHRGKGFGKALLRHLARICVDRGYGRFEWRVLDWNEPSIKFYESLGAKILPEWELVRMVETEFRALASR